MTERSYFWDGTVTGDAGPFTPDDYNHYVWSRLFALYRQEGTSGSGSLQGVIEGIGDELVVAGTVGGVSIKSGAALVDGTLYFNTDALTIPIPTQSVTEFGMIILYKQWATGKMRLQYYGTSGVAGNPSSILGDKWGILLARTSIDTSGNIVVADDRKFARSPLIPSAGKQLIETQTLTATQKLITFDDIPQTYRHLNLIGQYDFNTDVKFRINGLFTQNYAYQYAFGQSTNTPGNAEAGQGEILFFGNQNRGVHAAVDLTINNYRKTDTYRTVIGSMGEDSLLGFVAGLLQIDEPVTQIELLSQIPSTAPFDIGTSFSLYGII